MTKPRNNREAQAARLATTLPEARGELLDAAAATLNTYHAAVITRRETAASVAMEHLTAIVWKLNGGTLFGCQADDDAPLSMIERQCAATPGTVPQWGQRGEFLITVEGIRAVVEYRDSFGMMHHFAFHAVDLDRPFISETGYRSHFVPVAFGHNVQEAAVILMREMIDTQGRRPIAPDSRRFHEEAAPRPWLDGLPPLSLEESRYQDNKGQMAFGF